LNKKLCSFEMQNNYLRIYKIVRQIPRGRVATYGQIAELAGLEGHARQVGYALHSLPPGIEIPWHRVVNARGEVSVRSRGDSDELQRHLLEAEGVKFDERNRIDLKKHRWHLSGAPVSSPARRPR
jgi:methylated-DNA-protein-cysteine methyltransferase-like protein